MGRKVAEHPAAAVEEHERRKRARHPGWAYDHEPHGLSLRVDGPFGNVRFWEVDLDARLETFQYRTRLRRGHLLGRFASAGREGSQKDLDISLDSAAAGSVAHRAGLL